MIEPSGLVFGTELHGAREMRFLSCLILLVGMALAAGQVQAESYDPLRLTKDLKSQTVDLEFTDETREREIPLRVYLPAAKKNAPVVLFSHGLGGSRQNSAYLGKHWSARGYVAVFMQHQGSDESVWKDVPPVKRLQALKQATTLQITLDRFRDVSAVLDQLQRWHKDSSHALSGRVDLARVGMSGHSYGAVTTQAVSGQSLGFAGQRYADKRIRAAVAFSPSSPRRGNTARAFGSVKIPWMLMTGTKDTSIINDTTVESRTSVYPSLPNRINKYHLVLHNAEHSAFSDRPLPGDKERRNPNHHRVILALSTAFWDAHVREDAEALKWLRSEKVRDVLEKDDRWEINALQ